MTGRRYVDLIGKRFGRWTVTAIHAERYRSDGHHCLVLWLCRCDCGTERVVIGSHLRRGKSTNCGCVRREKGCYTTHGQCRGGKRCRAYRIWNGILQRCLNPNNTSYANYGGRGITVCEEWLSFENFFADMGDPPDGLSIDRIDNDGPYAPWNCRWATRAVQRANQRPPKRKRRRASVAEIRAYADSLARAASASGGVRGAP